MVFSAMHVFRRVKLLLWALFLAVAVPDGSAAATLSAEVSAESVFLGDAFTLAISLDGAPAPGGSPAIENTQGCAISAPQPRNLSSRNVTIVNGKFSEQVVERTSWIYAVRPEQAGAFSMGTASLEVDGRRLTALIPPVKVVGPDPQPHVRVALSASRSSVLPEETFDVVLDVTIARLPGVHAAVNPIAEGENAPHLDIPFFVDGAVSGCAFARPLDGLLNGLLAERPESGGFRVNNYSAPAQNSLFDFLGNRGPAVFHLARTAAELEGKPAWRYQLGFPFKATDEGTCRFPPVRFKGHVFIGGDEGAQPRPQVVFAVSAPLTVSVTPPPTEGRPASFIGSLGTRMAAAVTLDAQSCSEGDPILLTLEITGDQTLGNMKPPRIFDDKAMSERFRHYGDIASERVPAGMRYVYKIRPIQSGTIEVPALELAFFNTEKRQYETIRTTPVPLRVNPAAQLDPDAIYGIATNAARASLSIETEQYPSALTITVPTTGARRAASRGALLGVAFVPPALYAAVVAFGAFWRRRKTFGATLKRGAATGRAVRRILHAKTPQAAMDAVGAFLRDKFGERGAGFTPGDVQAILLRRGVDAATADEIGRRLQAVFDSGFTPGGDPAGTVKAHRHRLAELFATLKMALLACLLGGMAAAAEGAAATSFSWRQAASAAAQAQEPREFRAAAMLYREMIERGDGHGAALYNYGTLLLLAGFPAESFDALSRAEALQGATPEIENNLAIACAALRKAENGKDAMRQGADSGTGLPWYRVPLFWHYRVPMQVRVDWLAASWCVLWAGLLLRRLRLRRTGAALALAGLVVGLLLATSVLASHRVLAAALPDMPEATGQEGAERR